MAKSETQSKKFNFEAAMAELNQLVEKLERGGVPLEESLSDFEKGIALTRQCQHALQEAEQKVQILVEQSGQTVLQDYTEHEDNESA